MQLKFRFNVRFTISHEQVIFTDQARLKYQRYDKWQTVLASKVEINTNNEASRSQKELIEESHTKISDLAPISFSQLSLWAYGIL